MDVHGQGQPYLACSHDLKSGFCKERYASVRWMRATLPGTMALTMALNPHPEFLLGEAPAV